LAITGHFYFGLTGLCVFNEKWATSNNDWSPVPLDLRLGVADFTVDYITFIA